MYVPLNHFLTLQPNGWVQLAGLSQADVFRMLGRARLPGVASYPGTIYMVHLPVCKLTFVKYVELNLCHG